MERSCLFKKSVVFQWWGWTLSRFPFILLGVSLESACKE